MIIIIQEKRENKQITETEKQVLRNDNDANVFRRCNSVVLGYTSLMGKEKREEKNEYVVYPPPPPPLLLLFIIIIIIIIIIPPPFSGRYKG